MEDLRKEFEKMGFDWVETFIQSWNVVFKSLIGDTRKLEGIIENNLSAAFEYKCRALVRSHEEMIEIAKNFPEIFNDAEWKHNIMFLSKAIDSDDILKEFTVKQDIDQINYHKGVLFWSAKLNSLSISAMMKLASKKEYQDMTVRNINTTTKILALMNK